MALSGGGRLLKVVRGQVRGTIASAPRGLHGFGYDPIFGYHPLRRTFGELEAEEKNRVSHRGRALAKMKKALPALLHFEESGERVRSTGPRRATRRAKP
jgi:non-canonical purine NTP pyrophosphatase (RdgB/HAM1 family)